MNYLIECRSVSNQSNLSFYNDEEEKVAEIRFNKNGSNYQAEAYDMITHKTYYIKSRPLKIKRRFTIFDQNDEKLANITMGVKIIHSIIDANKYYFVKAAFWKIKYFVYDNRTVVNRLEILRKNRKRFFNITSNGDDFVIVLSLFLLARAVRIKSLLK